MSQTKFISVLLLILLQSTVSPARLKDDCKEIDAKVEVVKSESTGKLDKIKITLIDKGDFVVHLLNFTTDVTTELKKLEVSDLKEGEYSVVISGRGRDMGRCPYYKQIKIERQ
jgi:hypothetical protein